MSSHIPEDAQIIAVKYPSWYFKVQSHEILLNQLIACKEYDVTTKRRYFYQCIQELFQPTEDMLQDLREFQVNHFDNDGLWNSLQELLQNYDEKYHPVLLNCVDILFGRTYVEDFSTFVNSCKSFMDLVIGVSCGYDPENIILSYLLITAGQLKRKIKHKGNDCI